MSRLSASASVISIVLAAMGVAGSTHGAASAARAATTGTNATSISRVIEPKGKPKAVPAAPVNLPDSQGTAAHPAVVVEGGNLALQVGTQATPWFLTGINAYNLATVWGSNDGCGWGEWTSTSLAEFFQSLPANAVVRAWFFQSDATEVVNGVAERNWAPTDQLIATADKYNVHLVLTLGNQDGTCDDNSWKTADWYAGGYRSVPAQTGTPAGPGRTSYAQWVHDAVSRYAGSASIAMWEPINEPQATACHVYPGWNCWGQTSCPDEATATSALLSFYTTIGDEIHTLDPGKLVSDGSFGNSNCGTASSADFQRVIASPGIDVVGYHDYSGAVANPWDLGPRTTEATAVGKPTMVGESGVTGCGSATTRAQIYGQKIAAARADGVDAYVAWWYGGDGGDPTCDSPIDVDSPAWATIMDSSAGG